MDLKLHQQKIIFDKPIPSIPIHSLWFTEGHWQFVYVFETPSFLRKTEHRRNPLYIDGPLRNCRLKTSLKPHMVNIPLYSLEDLHRVLEQQQQSDFAFRERFLQENPYFTQRPVTTFTVKNKNQPCVGAFIVRVRSVDEKTTTFVGRR